MGGRAAPSLTGPCASRRSGPSCSTCFFFFLENLTFSKSSSRGAGGGAHPFLSWANPRIGQTSDVSPSPAPDWVALLQPFHPLSCPHFVPAQGRSYEGCVFHRVTPKPFLA